LTNVCLTCTGRGGFGYLKQWKWWSGLALSKFTSCAAYIFVIFLSSGEIVIDILITLQRNQEIMEAKNKRLCKPKHITTCNAFGN